MKVYLEQDYNDNEKEKVIMEEFLNRTYVDVNFVKKHISYELYILNKKGHYKFDGCRKISLDKILLQRYSLFELLKLVLQKIFGGINERKNCN